MKRSNKKKLCLFLLLFAILVIIASFDAVGSSHLARVILGIAILVAVVVGAIIFVDRGGSYDQNAYYDYGGLTKRHKDNRKER